MRKKLLVSMLSTVAFSLIVVTVLFVLVVNYQYKQNIKNDLRWYNNIIASLIEGNNVVDKKDLFNDTVNGVAEDIRITYIDLNGRVIYDSKMEYDNLNNHNSRQEVKEARLNGNGYSIRFSSSIKKNMMYYATVLKNGSIVRSSVAMEVISGIEGKYLRYYIVVLILVFIVSSLLSLKMADLIVKPIKELQYTTSSFARGEMHNRVGIFSQDEIGELSTTFNIMADKLESTLNDSVDKQNRLQAILKSMDSGIIAVDKNYKIIMINPYAENIFGINKDVIGENLLDIIRNNELENVFKNNIEDYSEIKILWPKERELRIKTADIINEYEHIGTVAVVQDITDIKKLENMRSQFVANVSHELKTPLTSIKGFAETLRCVDDVKTRERFLNIINDESERLTRLINDILTLSDIEQRKENKIEEFNVNEVINEVYYLMKNTAENKNISIYIVGEPISNLFGDKDKFEQMIINLVDNAVKYSENGDKVYIGTKETVLSWNIWVEDNGVGIPSNHISRLFERFYRVDKDRSRRRGGTGLGLAIVKHVAISFNGEIEVQSEVGKGSKFTIEIPKIKKM